jgi:hypothetical protein
VPTSARPDRLSRAEPTAVLDPPAPPAAAEPGPDALSQPDEPGPAPEAGAIAAPPASEPARDQAPPPGAADDGELLRQVQTLAADLQALVAELQGRGVIGAGWQQPAAPPEQETMPR